MLSSCLKFAEDWQNKTKLVVLEKTDKVVKDWQNCKRLTKLQKKCKTKEQFLRPPHKACGQK